MTPGLRIVAGSLRGRRIDAPPASTTRPITDRVKESLFNSLGARLGTLSQLPPFDVLDLFAGSGSIGIEALSRGARHCVFVEHDRRVVRVLRSNLAKCKLSDRAGIICQNAWSMRPPKADADGFGLIFVDPPYRDSTNVNRLSDLLDRFAARLTSRGTMVVRHGPGVSLPDRTPGGLTCTVHRTRRDMHIMLFERIGDGHDG